MVKFTNAIIVAALVAGPALTFAREHDQDFVSREVSEDFFSRDLADADLDFLLSRDFEDFADLSERDLQELYERDPSIFGKIFGGIKRVAGGLLGGRDFVEEDFEGLTERDLDVIFDGLSERDLQELYERNPSIFGKIFRGVKKVAGGLLGGRDFEEDFEGLTERDLETILGELSERDIQDLYERNPSIFGKIFGGIKRVAGGLLGGRDIDSLEDLSERDISELYERNPSIFGKIFRGVKKVAGGLLGGRDLEEFSERDLDFLEGLSERDLQDLYERDPSIFGKIFGGIKKVAGGLLGRDVESLEDLTERDWQDLYERDPSIFGKIFGGIKRVAGGLLGGRDFEDLQDLSEREIDELLELEERSEDVMAEEVAAREPFFFLAGLARKVIGKVAGKVLKSRDESGSSSTIQFARDLEIDELD